VLDRGGNALNDGFEYQGTWWLPGADIHKVPGILKFDPDAGATLNLLGSLKGLAGVTDPLTPGAECAPWCWLAGGTTWLGPSGPNRWTWWEAP